VIVLVGGFLGAGKTTLLVRAAREMADDGIRVALITNDQGGELVDTRFAESAGLRTGEVTGGCFCCRFSDLVAVALQLRAFEPQVILAEPVGSCTDIIATTVRPLEQYYAGEFRVAPYTVLVDPRRADALRADPPVAYLFNKQIEEADLLCFTHSDLAPDLTRIAGRPLRKLSGRTGEGVRAWLNEVLSGEVMPRHRVLDVDYAVYAEAEAALGWINWQADITLRKAAPPAAVLGPLFDSIDATLTESGVRICHLKGMAIAETGSLKASITANGDEPRVDGPLDAAPVRSMRLLINLRAVGDPRMMADVVRECSEKIAGNVAVQHAEAFRPLAPKPEFRLNQTL
jgi:hypothetical protein